MGQCAGVQNPQQQPGAIHQDDAGVTTTISYEGVNKGQVSSLIGSLGLAGKIPYDVTQTFGKARIDVKYPYDFNFGTPQTDVIGLWEFFAEKSEKDILTADMPFGSIGAISPADAQLVRTALSLYQQGFLLGQGWFSQPVDTSGNALTQYVVTSAPGVIPVTVAQQPVPPAANPAGCWSSILLMLRGQTSYPVFAPRLRFTQTVTAEYAIQASQLNAGRIISTASIGSLEDIPSGLLFSLPDWQNTYPPQMYIQTPGDLMYAWFKDFPIARQIARLKWNIVQEWQYGLWPVIEFGSPL